LLCIAGFYRGFESRAEFVNLIANELEEATRLALDLVLVEEGKIPLIKGFEKLIPLAIPQVLFLLVKFDAQYSRAFPLVLSPLDHRRMSATFLGPLANGVVISGALCARHDLLPPVLQQICCSCCCIQNKQILCEMIHHRRYL